MKKLLILLLGISLTAASCDAGEIFGIQAKGTRGIFRSEDSGETFVTANTLKPKGDLNAVSINSIGVDPKNPDVLFAGAVNGIYYSDDGAKTWRYILSGIAVTSIAVDDSNPQILYAAGVSGQNGKVIKSADSGKSWIDIYSEPTKNNAVQSVIVSKSNSNLILAGLTTGEIIRSQDSGATWQVVKDLANRIVKMDFSVGNRVYALTETKGLYKSMDLGLNWTELTQSLTATAYAQPGQSTGNVSAYHDFALDRKQAGVIYLGTEQGVFRSVNDGSNWAVLNLPVKNGALKTTAVVVNPANFNNLLAAIGGTILKSSNGGLTWETKRLPISAQIHSIVFNPSTSNIIYLGVRSQ